MPATNICTILRKQEFNRQKNAVTNSAADYKVMEDDKSGDWSKLMIKAFNNAKKEVNLKEIHWPSRNRRPS